MHVDVPEGMRKKILYVSMFLSRIFKLKLKQLNISPKLPYFNRKYKNGAYHNKGPHEFTFYFVRDVEYETKEAKRFICDSIV